VEKAARSIRRSAGEFEMVPWRMMRRPPESWLRSFWCLKRVIRPLAEGLSESAILTVRSCRVCTAFGLPKKGTNVFGEVKTLTKVEVAMSKSHVK